MVADIELVIKIPEKEFGIEINDKFQDFFSRLKAEIKAHLINETNLICGTYELETIDMFLEAFNNSIPLPKGHRGIVDLKSVQWAFDDMIVEDALRTGQLKATHNEIANILETVPTIIKADVENEEKVDE